MYLWESFATWMSEHVNAVGTRSAEDWIQFNVDEMNRLFAQSVYPAHPDGVKLRVAIDRIIRVPSHAVDPGGTHAPEPCPTDGCWGFGGDDPNTWTVWITNVHNQRDNGLLHELGHQLGLIDLYQMDVQQSECLISDGEPRVQTRSNSGADDNLDNILDGNLDSLIATYESRPVWFAVVFNDLQWVTRMQMYFSDGMTHHWQVWAAEDLMDAVDMTQAAVNPGGLQTDHGMGWADLTIDEYPHKAWVVHVDRLDFDRMSHVREWIIHDREGNKLDILGMLRSGRVAGTPAMPLIAFDVVHYNSVGGDLMSGADFNLDEYHVGALNWDAEMDGRGLPRRRGYYGLYTQAIPAENTLTITRNNQPVVGAPVAAYQFQDSLIPNVAKYAGVTDAHGQWSFPHVTTAEYAMELFGEPEPITTANPFSTIYSEFPHVVGTNGVIVIRVFTEGAFHYRFMDLPQFNMEHARGHQDHGFYELDVTLP